MWQRPEPQWTAYGGLSPLPLPPQGGAPSSPVKGARARRPLPAYGGPAHARRCAQTLDSFRAGQPAEKPGQGTADKANPNPQPKAAAMTITDELCPSCETADGVRWTGSTPSLDTWACNGCGHEWTITVAAPAYAT